MIFLTIVILLVSMTLAGSASLASHKLPLNIIILYLLLLIFITKTDCYSTLPPDCYVDCGQNENVV